MRCGDREFHELREQFEKNMKELIYGHKVDRVHKDAKVPAGEFYNDGYVNKLFHAYMMGYEFAKCVNGVER